VPMSAFIENLKKWWRDKSIQQADWDSWSRDITVSWVGVKNKGEAQE
jgi:hypothetical protein